MVRKLLFVLCISIVAGGCANAGRTEGCKAACDAPARVLRHVVMFKFKDGTRPEDIRKVESDFAALPDKIGAIHDFEWGTNMSVENVSQGYTHCFLVTFKSEADRQEYLPHPAHKEFGAGLRPYIDKVLVVDYWATR
jgi:hypothetical protein